MITQLPLSAISQLKWLIVFIFGLVLHAGVFAQNTPQAVNYQAVARDIEGIPLSEIELQIEVSIIQGGINGNEVYAETHVVTTDIFGLFNLLIGEGAPIVGDFSTIHWGINTSFLKVIIDAGQGSVELPTVQLLSVPYALHAAKADTAIYGADEDTNPFNEFQTIAKDGNVVSLSNGGGSFTDEIDDADNNPANEIQDLSSSASNNERIITITGGTSTTIDINDEDADPNNEIQSISKDGNQVTLSDGGGSFTVDDDDANPTNEIQDLSSTETGNERTISITGGLSTTINIDDDDASATNEIQDLSSIESGSERTISITGGQSTTIDIDDADPNPENEIQSLQLDGNILSLSDDPTLLDVDLASFSGENQVLSLGNVTDDEVELKLTGSTSVNIPIQDADSDPDNEFQTIETLEVSVSNERTIRLFTGEGGDSFATFSTDDNDPDPDNERQELLLNGNNLSITNNINATPVDLSVINTDSQTLDIKSTSLTEVELEIFGGNTVTIEIEDADADPDNERQELQLNGNNLSITNNVNATPVDLSGINTDSQTLDIKSTSLTEVELEIFGGNAVNIEIEDADADPENEMQDLLLDGNNLTISKNTSAIPIDLDDIDDQELTVQSTLGSDVTLSLQNSAPVVKFSINDGDFESTNEIQNLVLNSTMLSLTKTDLSDFVDLSVINTDNQKLSVEDESSGMVTLKLTGSTPETISFSVDDSDSDSSNEIITNVSLNPSDNVLHIDEAGFSNPVNLSSLKEDENWVKNGNNISNTNTGNVGINEANPTSNLFVNGSMGAKVKIVSDGVHTINDETIIIGKPVNDDVEVNLPDASTVPGRIYYFKKGNDNQANDLVILPAPGQTIELGAGIRLRTVSFFSIVNQGVVLISDGIDSWWIISSY